HPLARRSWTGSVTSNEVVLLVLPTDGYGEEVKGLRAKITLAKTKFEVGEAIPVSYVVKNVSKEEQTLWHCGFWPNHQIFVNGADGKNLPLTEFGRQCRKAFTPGGPRDKNVPVKVPAGGEDAADEKYDLTKLYDLSKPGRYTVQYFYEEKPVSGWEGQLPSNIVTFEVVAHKEDPKNVTEKDGVKCEILVPDRVWTIPEQPAGRTEIRFGLRITNTTNKPIRFTRFDTLHPVAVGPDGKAMTRSGGRNETLPMKESDCPVVESGA